MTIRKPFFVVPLGLGTVAAQNSTSGFPVAHLGRPRDIGLVWKTTGTMWARGDMGSAQSIDFAALIGTNAQAGTSIRLRLGTTQAEVDGTAPYDSGVLPLIYVEPSASVSVLNSAGASFATGLAVLNSAGSSFTVSSAVLNSAGSSFTVSSGSSMLSPSGLFHSHLEISALQSARWWRIDISGHSGTFEAMSLVLGTRLAPTYFYNTDFEYGTEPLGTMDFTRLGVADVEPGITLRTMGFSLSWMTRAEWEVSFRPFVERLGKTGVAYLCFDPEANIYRQNNTFLGPMKKWPVARGLVKPGFFTSEWTLNSPI